MVSGAKNVAEVCLQAPSFALEVGMFRIELETVGVILKTVLQIYSVVIVSNKPQGNNTPKVQ